MIDIIPDGHTDAITSFLLMMVVFGLSAYIARQLFLERRRLKREEKAADDAARTPENLAAGPSFVTGTVEFDDEAEYAVVVELRQKGRERRGRRGGSTHQWVEVERRVFARPFWISLERGERVRVEPGETVDFVDELNMTVHDTPKERYRIAELTHGERVTVAGRLRHGVLEPSAGYREAGRQGWVLAPGKSPLRLRSGGFGAYYGRLARAYTMRLVFGWLPCLLLLSLVYSGYLARLSVGEVSSVQVRLRTYGSATALVYESEGEERRILLDEEDRGRVHDGDRLAYTRVEGWPGGGELGSTATFPLYGWFFALIIALIGALTLLPPQREWHDVREFGESGNGKLPYPKKSDRKVHSRQ